MGLPKSYTQAYSMFNDFFGRIRDAQAPDKFTQQQLKDWGYKSKNHRPFIPLLKALGFLSSDGTPTLRYHEYRNHSQSKAIMGDALKEAYSDIFLIKALPTQADKDLIQGKFKSYHNASDNVAKLHTNTFFALLEMADVEARGAQPVLSNPPENSSLSPEPLPSKPTGALPSELLGLHYNIQIHLPATKDLEVYNAIFKSLKEHLID
ncbi:MAG: DUF5343 domain-containing protein [Pseudomonadota bacterium]